MEEENIEATTIDPRVKNSRPHSLSWVCDLPAAADRSIPLPKGATGWKPKASNNCCDGFPKLKGATGCDEPPKLKGATGCDEPPKPKPAKAGCDGPPPKLKGATGCDEPPKPKVAPWASSTLTTS
jgi:hypothetical protein